MGGVPVERRSVGGIEAAVDQPDERLGRHGDIAGPGRLSHLPPDENDIPSVDQLQAFYTAFEPDWRRLIEQIGDLERPDELSQQIDDLIDAGRSLADHMATAANDDAAAQSDIDAGGTTEDDERLVDLGTQLGLTTCVE